MMLPADVKLTVRLSQALAIFIALFNQADLLQGIQTLFNGMPSNFKGPDDRFASMTATKWNITCIIRIVQGSLNLFAAFLLLIQSETVFDVLLNFLGECVIRLRPRCQNTYLFVIGVAFVSDLDDMAFVLGKGSNIHLVQHYKFSCNQPILFQVQLVILEEK